MTNRDRYDNRIAGWMPGAVVALIITVMAVIGAIAYAISDRTFGTGPSTSTSAPSTPGQVPPAGTTGSTASRTTGATIT
jgi:hypothetical protein